MFKPYRDAAANKIYHLLFCDDPAAFAELGPPGHRFNAIFTTPLDEDAVRAIANDMDVESRVRALAYNRLNAAKKSVPRSRLLGVVLEIPVDKGLDTLAAYEDGRIRYINASGKMSIIDVDVPALRTAREELLRVSQILVNQIGPWDKPRLPPPTKRRTRMSFVVSDGLYFGEGVAAQLLADRFGGAILRAGAQLLTAVVDFSLADQAS